MHFGHQIKLKELLINFEEIKKVSDSKDPSKGKLLLFMHTPNLDLVVRIASLFMNVSGMARPQSNKIVDNLFKGKSESLQKEFLTQMKF